MNVPQSFADVNLARATTRKLYPDAKAITLIEHSHDNIVALVDDSYAVRFPRDKNSYMRSLFERHILKQLEKVETLTIPKVLSESNNPPYVVTSFLTGEHVSSATIRKFTSEQQINFGKTVAQFAYTMHKALKLTAEQGFREELGLDELADNEPWPIYYKKVIHDTKFPTPAQDKLAKDCYAKWVRLCNVPPTVVVHDDLHTENMMFDNNQLMGVLDFGDTSVGTPEQELRQLYRINNEVMLAGVEEYQRLSGYTLNVEAIKLWAIMKELADYSKAISAENTSHHSFVRACRNLNVWLPDGEWGKGYDLSKQDGYQ